MVIVRRMILLITLVCSGTSVWAQESDEDDATYDKQSIIQITSDFLGEGSDAVARVVEKVFADLGRPNGYITGSEISAAAIVGLRYGDGDLNHKIEGKRRVFWTGPSLGIDLGGNASRVVVLVYHLYDTEEIYGRFPAVEGSFYYVGGVGVNYQQKDDIILAPIRVGVGLRLGANLGYMHYTKSRTWMPF
ncbi:MAG: DUF1134 domain-containing protein [Alphaproteobacteria bacterium]|nr:MAG: DUF1134 domain-containing protein [Alphaproteobacteria bacterium]